MLAKSLKIAMVLAVVLTFFGGNAMADNRGRDGHHPTKWDRGHQNHQADNWRHHDRDHHQGARHHVVYRYYGHRHPAPATYYRPQQRVYTPHPLAPRIVFLGPIPVPVPPPPHEVIGYITGHR